FGPPDAVGARPHRQAAILRPEEPVQVSKLHDATDLSGVPQTHRCRPLECRLDDPAFGHRRLDRDGRQIRKRRGGRAQFVRGRRRHETDDHYDRDAGQGRPDSPQWRRNARLVALLVVQENAAPFHLSQSTPIASVEAREVGRWEGGPRESCRAVTLPSALSEVPDRRLSRSSSGRPWWWSLPPDRGPGRSPQLSWWSSSSRR